MKFILLPLAVAVAMLGLRAIFAVTYAPPRLPPRTVVATEETARIFVAYRNYALSYVLGNPTFTGQEPLGFSAGLASGVAALGLVLGNQVVPTASGEGGRVIYSWAVLPPTAAPAAAVAGYAANLADGDVSIGVVSGNNWISTLAVGAPGQTGTPLNAGVAIPNGALVSVVQVGD